MSNENFFQPSPAQISAPEKENNQKTNNIYGDIPILPVYDAVEGIKFDFNSGLRVHIPEGTKKYRLKFIDMDKDLVLHDNNVDNGCTISSVKKYYIRLKFIITRQETGEVVFEHEMNLKDKPVLINFPVRTLGDSIGWFSYVERFQQKHQCKLLVLVSDFLKEIVQKQYPNLEFISKEEVLTRKIYATYYLGLFFGGNLDFQPIDFRYVGLHRTAGMILGLRTQEELADIPPRVDLSAKRKIKEKYVVISVKASAQCKHWNNPMGWDTVISFLKDNGYRVICIDKEKISGTGTHYNYLPWGVEDDTGNKTLQERIDMIKDADFFIGLASGLSWLAWCCKVPVVMISGFSLPNTEFYTPYRVINYTACVGCWDDTKENFDHNNFLWCPRHSGNEDRMYECTRYITPAQVINTIKTIPTFKPCKKK